MLRWSLFGSCFLNFLNREEPAAVVVGVLVECDFLSKGLGPGEGQKSGFAASRLD